MAMILVLIAVAMASVLSLTMLSSNATSIGISQNADRQTRARGIAESAMLMTVTQIQSNPDWRTDYANGQWIVNQSLEGGTVNVWVVDGDLDSAGNLTGDGDLSNNLADKVVITAQGRFNGVTHTIRSVVTPSSTFGTTYKVLFVLGGSTPTSAEQTRITLLQDLGMTVSTIASSASQQTFNTNFGEVDVVYVSSEAGILGTQVKDAPIGVVTEEGDTYSPIGFSSSSSSYNGTVIEVTDNGHYITSKFAAGEITITSSSQTLSRLNGTIGAGVRTLGERVSSSNIALAILDKGATKYGDDSSPGRRVMLPWGGEGFEVATLTADGKTLLKRAVQWAATTPTEGGGAWTGVDVGNYSPAGSNSFDNGVFTVLGAGNDIWNSSDQFRFVHQQLTGNGTITARVTQVQNTDAWAKAGVMIRETLSAGSRHAMMVVTPGNNTAFQRRTSTNSSSSHTASSGNAPYWVRMDRLGNTLTAYRSPSGNDGSWVQVGNVTLSNLPQTIYFGMCVTSHKSGTLCTAKFDNVSLTGGAQTEGDPEDEENEDVAPQLIVKYEFDEVAPPDPVLIHHWTLDDTGGTGGGFAVADTIEMSNSALINSYNSTLGAYSGTNSGSDASVSTNSTGSDKVELKNSAAIQGNVFVGSGGNPNNVIDASGSAITGQTGALAQNVAFPTVAMPSGLSSSGEFEAKNNSSVTISSDKRYSKMEISNNATVNISGDITIRVDGKFELKNNGRVIIPSGSSLKLYVGDNVEISNHGKLHDDSASPQRLEVYMVDDDKKIELKNNTVISGFIYSANDLEMSNSAEIFGKIMIADDVEMKNDAAIRLDVAMASFMPAVATDIPGSADGSFKNGVTLGETGQSGSAVRFNGSSSYVEIPHADSMRLDSGTVAFWFKADSTAGQQGLFSKDSSDYDTGGHLGVWIWNGVVKARLESTTDAYWVESDSIAADTWYHVAVSWGSTGMRLFLNGTLVDTEEYTGGLGDTSGGSGNHEPIVLGASSWESGNLTATPVTHFFEGWLDDVRIYDQGFDASQAASLYNGNDPGEGGTGYLVQDTSGFGAPLDLVVENTARVSWVDGGGLIFTDETRAASPGAATKIHDALTATNRMTIEVKFRTSTLSQDGPARIVSYSSGSSNRNFTFGQYDAAYGMRLRTSSTGNNGTPDIESADVLNTGTLQHVIVTYDGETVKMYRNGALESETSRNGDFTWNNAYKLVLGNEAGDDQPWLGELYRMTIYDQALNALQVQDLFNGQPPGDHTEEGAIAFHLRWYENP